MAAENDLIIKITAETDRAVKEIKKLTTEVNKFTKTDDKVSKTTVKNTTAVNKGFASLKVSMAGLVTGAAVLGIAMKAIEFSTLAADAEQAADAFDRIIEGMGLNAEEEFQKIKDAAKGLIPDAAIKQSAVTAVSLGVPLEKLAELMEIARVKAREMGTTAQSAFNDLATGIGRGSPMILDNLGLTIKLGDANKKMAVELGKTVEALTKEEKQMALTNAVIDAGSESVERFGDVALTAKENSQKFDAAIDNLKVKIGGALLPAMDALTVVTTKFINSIVGNEAKKSLDGINQSLKDIKETTKDIPNEVKQTVEEMEKVSDITFGAIFDGANVITIVDEAKKDIEGAGTEIVFYPTVELKPEQVEFAKAQAQAELTESLKIGLDVEPDTINIIKVLDATTKNIEKSVSLDIPAKITIDDIKAATEVKGAIKNLEDAAQLTVQFNPNIKLTEDALKEYREKETTTDVIFDPIEDAVNKSAEYWEDKTIYVPVVFVPQGATGGVTDQIVDDYNSQGGN